MSVSPQPWELFMTMDADAHINEHTVISHQFYVGEDRVTVTFSGANQARMTLFLPHPELVRLRDILTGVIAEFETERASLADPGVTDSAA